MSIEARIGGVIKTLSPRIRVASTWKTPASAWVKVAGVWRQAFVDFSVDLAASFYGATGLDTTSPFNSRAGFRINSDGRLEKGENNGTGLTYSNVENWLEGGSASQADVRIVTTTGTPVGMTSGTWYNCGTTREFYITKTTAGTDQWTGTLEFRNASTLAALDSATIDLYVENGTA